MFLKLLCILISVSGFFIGLGISKITREELKELRKLFIFLLALSFLGLIALAITLFKNIKKDISLTFLPIFTFIFLFVLATILEERKIRKKRK